MLQEILNSRNLLYVMAVVCAVGIISKLGVWISYRRLMKATDNMSASKNALTRQLKLKFENCYKLNLNVQNVPVFVDKYLQKYKVFGIRVHTANRLLQIALLLSAGMGVVACTGVIWFEMSMKMLVLYGAVAILSVLALYLTEYMLDIEDKKEIAVTNLQDYLENVLTNRLHHEYEEEPGKELVKETEAVELLKQGKAQTAAAKLKVKKSKSKKPKKDSIDEEEVIREILREFLT